MGEQTAGIGAVVLAGGKAKPEMVEATGVENRALIKVNGRTMLDHVVTALNGAPTVGKVVVVGNVGDSDAYQRVDDQGDFVANLFAGLNALGDAAYAVVATSDIPFITAEAIEDCVQRGAQLNADVIYTVVPVARCYERFPGVKRTAVTLRDGHFTGGNVMIVRPAFMNAHQQSIAEAYAARKKPLRLALMLGIGVTLRAAIAMKIHPSVLDIATLERAASRLLGGTARALQSDYPEIATDIDRVSDLKATQA